jgi:hypothetical protein
MKQWLAWTVVTSLVTAGLIVACISLYLLWNIHWWIPVAVVAFFALCVWSSVVINR